jgi:ABC-type phosphate/phosphonate transport system substrate-binding protein
MIGPAHVIGSAVRYGYEPVARFPGEERAVFIASAASGVTTLEGARNKRLALPPTDSLATYLARGELNAMGVQAKSFFKEIREFRYHEAALLALQLGAADVAVADRRLAEEWVARNKGRILLETKGAPTTAVAVLSTLDKGLKDRIRDGRGRARRAQDAGDHGQGIRLRVDPGLLHAARARSREDRERRRGDRTHESRRSAL